MRIPYSRICCIVILITTGIFFLLNIHDDRIFQEIIAQEGIPITNDSLLKGNQNQLSIHDKNIIVQLLASHLETKLNKSVAILEIASKTSTDQSRS